MNGHKLAMGAVVVLAASNPLVITAGTALLLIIGVAAALVVPYALVRFMLDPSWPGRVVDAWNQHDVQTEAGMDHYRNTPSVPLGGQSTPPMECNQCGIESTGDHCNVCNSEKQGVFVQACAQEPDNGLDIQTVALPGHYRNTQEPPKTADVTIFKPKKTVRPKKKTSAPKSRKK